MEEIKRLVIGNAAFIMLFVGVAFVTFSFGPYQNWDTSVEFEAASNIVKMGLPYSDFFHGIINQPPLGFYSEAAIFRIFGLSLSIGQTLIALFGLATVVVVYALGKELYGKTPGLFAAALFALSPWQLIVSRSFLIDAQCLLFSLLCLYVGIKAIRKNSVNLALVAGVLFAAAAMTKLYAVFMLLPLTLIFISSKPRNIQKVAKQVVVFTIPVVLSALFWYQIALGTSPLSIFGHHDLSSKIPDGMVPSYLFVLTFLNDYGIGFFFIIATIFSFVVCLSFRKQFPRTTALDLICLATIGFILSFNAILVFGWNLNVPYISAIKYDYQTLPFFSLIVASLTYKTASLFKLAKTKISCQKTAIYVTAFSGIFLMVASLLFNMIYVNGVTALNYLLFRVQRYQNYGFGLFNYTPLSATSPFMIIQYIGFAIVLSALFLASSPKVLRVFKKVEK